MDSPDKRYTVTVYVAAPGTPVSEGRQAWQTRLLLAGSVDVARQCLVELAFALHRCIRQCLVADMFGTRTGFRTGLAGEGDHLRAQAGLASGRTLPGIIDLAAGRLDRSGRRLPPFLLLSRRARHGLIDRAGLAVRALVNRLRRRRQRHHAQRHCKRSGHAYPLIKPRSLADCPDP